MVTGVWERAHPELQQRRAPAARAFVSRRGAAGMVQQRSRLVERVQPAGSSSRAAGPVCGAPGPRLTASCCWRRGVHTAGAGAGQRLQGWETGGVGAHMVCWAKPPARCHPAPAALAAPAPSTPLGPHYWVYKGRISLSRRGLGSRNAALWQRGACDGKVLASTKPPEQPAPPLQAPTIKGALQCICFPLFLEPPQARQPLGTRFDSSHYHQRPPPTPFPC